MSALGVIHSAMVQIPGQKIVAPVTNSTGGTSVGNPAAGTGGSDDNPLDIRPATGGDRAGAGILTTLVLGGFLGGIYFMVTGA